MSYTGHLAGAKYGEAPAAPACTSIGVERVDPKEFNGQRQLLRCTTPGGVDRGPDIKAAVARAVAMMDNTINQLTQLRTSICRGEMRTWVEQLSDTTILGDWMKNRLGVCINDVRAWTAPWTSAAPTSVAYVIRRLINVRNLIASNRMQYVCGGADCRPGVWAYVLVRFVREAGVLRCLDQSPAEVIYLCPRFWGPSEKIDARGVRSPTTPEEHARFQSLAIIHEASHIYYCNDDWRGATIGIAECLAQFIGVTNNVPFNAPFFDRCTQSTRCTPRATAAKRA